MVQWLASTTLQKVQNRGICDVNKLASLAWISRDISHKLARFVWMIGNVSGKLASYRFEFPSYLTKARELRAEIPRHLRQAVGLAREFNQAELLQRVQDRAAVA